MVEPIFLPLWSYSGCCIHRLSLNTAWHAKSSLDSLVSRSSCSFPLVTVTILLGKAQGISSGAFKV